MSAFGGSGIGIERISGAYFIQPRLKAHSGRLIAKGSGFISSSLRRMIGVNRVPLVAVCWFIVWTTVGFLVGRLTDTPGYYTVLGFVFALVSIFAWPLIFPDSLQDWMDE
jgi:hypothetical protein